MKKIQLRMTDGKTVSGAFATLHIDGETERQCGPGDIMNVPDEEARLHVEVAKDAVYTELPATIGKEAEQEGQPVVRRRKN